MQLTCCFSCKRVLFIRSNQEKCYCKNCRNVLRKILTIPAGQDKKKTFNFSQIILEKLTRKITSITSRSPWFYDGFSWVERIAYYVALIQSYVRVDPLESQQAERRVQFSPLTRKAAIYYLIILEKILYEFIDGHLEEKLFGEDDKDEALMEPISYDPYVEMDDISSLESYMESILDVLVEFEEIAADFERALNLHKNLLLFFRDRVHVKQEKKSSPLIDCLSPTKIIKLDELVFISSPQKPFDTDLLLLLERGRDLLHHGGPLLFDYLFNIEYDEKKRTLVIVTEKIAFEKYELQQTFFNLLSEDAMQVDLWKIWTFPDEFVFEKLLIMLIHSSTRITFFTTSSPMPFKTFLKIEVVERKNYTFQEVKEWAKLYSLDADTMVIWVSPYKRIAYRYKLPADQWDDIENIPEDQLDVDEITTEHGFMIRESNDGIHGYLFVYFR